MEQKKETQKRIARTSWPTLVWENRTFFYYSGYSADPKLLLSPHSEAYYLIMLFSI